MKLTKFNTAVLIFGALLIMPAALYGQQERKYIRKGNRLYEKSKYPGSEIQYRRAQGIDKPIPDANFNVGDALYKQKKYQDAAEQYEQAVKEYKTPDQAAEAYYNMGNALLKEQKYKESVESYINSLKYSPDNMDAKYNLAYARRMMKKQQEQQKQEQQNQQNKDEKQKQNQQNKDQNKDQNKEQNKDQNKDQNQNNNQDKQNQNNGQDQQNQQNQNQDQQGNGSQQPRMSREDATRLLDALSANEKDVQAKVNKDKKAKGYVRVTKNW